MEATFVGKTNLRYDRVRENTQDEINRNIDEQTNHCLRLYAKADKETIAQRLAELDREWDMERALQTNAAGLSLGGFVMGIIGGRQWFILPVVVAGFLMQHAMQGWCPPIALFRRLGFRTRKEIERERQALKLLRGDFDAFHSGEQPDIEKVLEMVDR